MSTAKKVPPIQPAPFQKFTVRLVDGHFVRVPKFDQTAATDATRPPTVLSPGAARMAGAGGEHAGAPAFSMRLINGRFVKRTDLVADRASDAEGRPPVTPTGANGLIARVAPAPALAPAPAAPPPRRTNNIPHSEQWALTFGDLANPSDSPAKS